MPLRIVFLSLAAVVVAMAQQLPTCPVLNSDLPNVYTTARPLITSASTSDPALNPPAASLCVGSSAICVLTAQYDNARTDANALENKFTTGDLLAYSLRPSGTLSSNPIWPSSLPSTADFVAAPYAIPTVVNGKVYVPTYGLADGNGGYTKSGIEVYGL